MKKQQVKGWAHDSEHNSLMQSKAQKLKPHSNAEPVGGPNQVQGKDPQRQPSNR